MGLKTSPKAFHNLMEVLLRGQKYRNAMPYMDDVICYGTTWEDHMASLKDVLSALKKGGIKLKRSKCSFGLRSLSFLGYIIDAERIRPDPEKVRVIHEFPVLKSVKQVRSFNGLAQSYRRFIRGSSTLMRPLYGLTKQDKKFEWTDEAQRAFDAIKKAITTDVVIVHPDFQKRFTICTDASAFSVGASTGR